MRVYVAGLRDISLIDYPRKPSMVIWLQGCNFKCHYCYNYELWNMREENCIEIEKLTNKIRENTKWIEACKITGGEPTIQSEALEIIGEECKRLKLNFGIDTNGTKPEIVKKLIKNELIDHIAIDLKAPLNPEDYSKIVGVKLNENDMERIKETLKTALENPIMNVEIRIPIIRGLNNDAEKILEMRRNILETGYIENILKDMKEVSIEILEVMHEVSANEELRKRRNLTVKELVEIGEIMNLPKTFIRHRKLGLRESLSQAKMAMEKA